MNFEYCTAGQTKSSVKSRWKIPNSPFNYRISCLYELRAAGELSQLYHNIFLFPAVVLTYLYPETDMMA